MATFLREAGERPDGPGQRALEHVWSAAQQAATITAEGVAVYFARRGELIGALAVGEPAEARALVRIWHQEAPQP